MTRQEAGALEAALRKVPPGAVLVERYAGEGDAPSPLQPLQARADGRGRMEVYTVYPGVEAAFSRFWASRASFSHGATPWGLEIYHCRAGRVGWNMQEGVSVYLGAGDLSLHSMGCCARSEMLFPVGYSEGIALSIDLEQLEEDCPPLLREAGVSPRALFEKFCRGGPLAMPGNAETDSIFSPLYPLPANWRLPYLRLKVQELLLTLWRWEPRDGRQLAQYGSQQTELIREIHDLLTQHLDQRFTIEELSRRYPINTSSLKEVFKAVYGQPVATYMKQYRIRRAMELLRETRASVAEIAAQVGYESQGKFTKAFKDVTQQLPTQYRRQL